jgi:Multimeric flavodoxin WrbA
MMVLGIAGSPHPNGNTAYAVNYALDVLSKQGIATTYISLAGKNIKPCIGCWKCSDTGVCFQNDDMSGIIELMKLSDGILIGSSVHFGMVSGQLKTMMDRCVQLRPNYGEDLPLSGKTGGAIACAYSRNGGQETTLQNIQTFMLQMNMRVISDGPAYTHAGATLMGEAKDDAWGLETVKNLALNMARMLRR